jgi:hypothetical protein
LLRRATIQTPKSTIQIPKLALRTHTSLDFNDFDDRVVFDGILAPSKINLHDIAYFAPDIRGMDQTIYLSGVVKERLRELQIQNLNLRLGKATQVQANLRLPDFRKPTSQQWLQEQITKAHIDLNDIADLHLPLGTPAIQIPTLLQKANYFDLKNAQISGTYSNLQVSFTKANSALGSLSLAPIEVKSVNDELKITGLADSSF